MSPLELNDLFALGVGLDIGGGYLVARGLIASPGDILRRTLNGEDFFLPDVVASQITDKADATSGLFALLSGFVIQAVAYALAPLTSSTPRGSPISGDLWSALLVMVAALVGVGVALLGWRLARWKIIRRTIIAIATDPLTLGSDFERVERNAVEPLLQSGTRLVLLGSQFGYPQLLEETASDYARRVFGIQQISDEHDVLATAFHPARLL